MSKVNGCKCNPVIRWVGGKSQLLPVIRDKMPSGYGRYYEPFMGGGALFFSLAPEEAVLNDANSGLINLYTQLRNNPDRVLDELDRLQGRYNSLPDLDTKKDIYYDLRTFYNQCTLDHINTPYSAALFVFLNKACFNGLYRENSKGEFNTSFGKKKTLKTYERDNVLNVSSLLTKATLLSGDYKDACHGAANGDFVFFDPPYYDTFDTYKKGGFPDDEHRIMADLFKALTDKGVYCMLTNSNTEFIKDLYREFQIEVVPVRRSVNRNGKGRTGEEVIITNY